MEAPVHELRDLAAFGATPEGIVTIDGSTSYRHLDYLDLPALPPTLPRVRAVVELANRPILYSVRGPLSGDQVSALCHLLAQRGAADHLGILEPGLLTVIPLIRTSSSRSSLPQGWRAAEASARGRLPGLAFGTTSDHARGTGQHLHDGLVTLLTNATKAIVKAGVHHPEDALSLVGRALFFRFLIDRRIVHQRDSNEICPGAHSLIEAMDTPSRVAATSRWLETTFNGNLLPLSSRSTTFWRSVEKPKEVCHELAKILAKSDASGQLRFDWATLDFGHIPVGLLSQVYERWCHTFSRTQAIRDSVWYTPRAIAEYLVDEAFYDLDEPHSARVLDPAVGAGVFLVAAYRQIVAARWQHDGVRPKRRALREILYKQLAGFDVSEASLRLTALALYLTALELDPEPHPANKLRFDDLRKRGVLTDVRGPLDNDPNLPMVGSLGPHIDSKHAAAYDVVLGNPPWTAWTSTKDSRSPAVTLRRVAVEKVISPILRDRLQTPDANFEMVDAGVDLSMIEV